VETVPGNISVYSLQKTAVLGISHVIRIVLQYETWSLSVGVHHWFKGRRTRGGKETWKEIYYYYYYYYYYV